MRVLTAAQAAELVQDDDTLLIGGSGGGHAVPESILAALEDRFLASESPQRLTALHPVGLGDEDRLGVGHLAHEGLLKRVVCGAFTDAPKVAAMAAADTIEAYTLPQGALSQLMREMAAGRPGLVTKVGLHTFVDPRSLGGRQSASATEDLIELVEFDGQEWLRYKPFRPDVALLRGTTADEDGNLSMEQEAVFGEMLSMAQATKRAGGIVIAQVRRIARRGTLPPKSVKVPGILIDAIVVDPDQRQTYDTAYSPAYAGEIRVPAGGLPIPPIDIRTVIARRAALELYPGAVCNLGAGISTRIAAVAWHEGVTDAVTFTNEQGLIGGAPASGNDAGAATNYSCMVDQPYQFDFYDGGGLDLAFLSFAEADRAGNANVSRFNNRIIGVGGFVNISQNARKIVFSGTFTAGGLKVEVADGALRILSEGRHPKFVEAVQQISFNGKYALENGQEVMFVTERAVFRLTPGGFTLVEIAPGIDLEQDVLAQMTFPPTIAPELAVMDRRLFGAGEIALAETMASKPRSSRVRRSHLLEVS
ncbi:acyl CoA:acetate/3-ketoacid CoA transferase [Sinosporangium siamense]|uniref:Acetate CoA-transferase YdiF n=1 Tax=Sinosporangium siamense TaxID=1367973 RepID=A0A919RKJ8_9ACTN|nr:CoA-transferase [Sinosporangium siamense]GII95545.1 acetate CoA-transferase YdiF [Sinosporangium siamense]